MEARILAVLVWSTTALTLGTAIAARHSGTSPDWVLFGIALAGGLLGQGYTTHAINEIRDWTSGADRSGMGGSKVIREGLLTIAELWVVFWASIVLVVGLACVGAQRSGPGIYLFMAVALASGILYSLPPFQFAYRPFLGEWLGAAPGILSCVTGAFYIQTRFVSMEALLLGGGFALQCMAIMLMYHTMDYESDRAASPCKNTTIVFLGPLRSRSYVLLLHAVAVVIFGYASFAFSAVYAPLAAQAVACGFLFASYDPLRPRSILEASKRITLLTIAGGVICSALVEPRFAVMAAVAAAGFASHRRFGKLPSRRPAAGVVS